MFFVVFSCLFARCLSMRDPNYFITGGGQGSMFWRDAADVLDDLNSFSKLYVAFHNCAWSPTVGDDAGCGEDADDQFWYMGTTECFRANAAFSLYGVLKGKVDVGCGKGTFINSFFTTSGVETFTQAISDAGFTFQSNANGGNDYPGGVSSQCTAEESNANADSSTSHNAKNGAGYTSYGLGCYKSAFALKMFNGQFCDGRDEVRVSDKLANFNNDIQKASCVQIYSSTEGDSNGLDVLQYSSACSIREFPGNCPDPYGKLSAYSRSDAKAVATAASPARERAKAVFSWILLVVGVMLLLFSMNVAFRRARRSRRKSVMEMSSKRHWFSRKKSLSSENVPARSTESFADSGKRTGQSRRLLRCFSLRS